MKMMLQVGGKRSRFGAVGPGFTKFHTSSPHIQRDSFDSDRVGRPTFHAFAQNAHKRRTSLARLRN